jgi:hypothetical protein
MTPLEFCKKYLENYTINPDKTIDVDGDVNLYQKLGKMKKLPVKFGKVSGEFDCRKNNLISLEGCPNYVGGSFLCNQNKLTTLEGCPIYVGDYFSCIDNEITTLEGGPKYVGDFFACENNNLTTLECCPKYVGKTFYSDILTHHVLGNIQGVIYYIRQRIVI